MLRNHGFKVVDLGKNVSKEDFLEEFTEGKGRYPCLKRFNDYNHAGNSQDH